MSIKRAFDLAVVALLLPLVIPLVIFTAALVRINLGSPVLFRQKRPGKSGEIFEMIKFLSMTDRQGEDSRLLPDDQRLTRFGRFLRSSSLDELPELWNVAKGEMSLVGPRPLLVEYLPLYSPSQARRHEVPPGLTGWAQVNGRNALSWEEKFALDVWYVDNRSLWLDLKIMVLTAKRVFARSGISAPGEATMSRFSGTEGESRNRGDTQC